VEDAGVDRDGLEHALYSLWDELDALRFELKTLKERAMK
jgi:hypothetical protein